MKTWKCVSADIKVLAVVLVFSSITGSLEAGTPPCELGKRVPADVGEANEFGAAVDTDGDVAIVGAPLNGSMGAAYTFRRQGVSWVQEQKLLPFDVPAGSLFFNAGVHVEVDGEVAVVAGSGLDESFNDTSSVFVYRYDPGTQHWNNERALTAADLDTVDGDLSPFGVALADGLLAVSYVEFAPTGFVVLADIFRYDTVTSTWRPDSTRLVISESALAPNGFGTTLDLTDTVFVAGTTHVTSTVRTGKVFLFRFDGAGWTSDGTLTNPGIQVDDEFGWPVAVSGDLLVVGAGRFDDANAGTDAGIVRMYGYNGSSWALGDTIRPDDHDAGDRFGQEIALDGETLLVGVPRDDEIGVSVESGSVYVFRPDETGALTQIAKLKASDAESRDHFGVVAVSGDYALVGAPDEDAGAAGAGAAYFFGGVSEVDCDGNGQFDVCEILGVPALDDDADGILDGCEIVGDTNNDGIVGILDFLAVLANWGPCPAPCPYDTDDDGLVGILDFLNVLANWG